MTNKKLVPLLACALSFGSIAKADVTDRLRTNDGAECSQIYTTGKELTTGVRLRGDGLEPELYMEFKFDLGRKKLDENRLDCNPFAELEEERLELDNEKLRIEVELLRNQLKNQTQKEKDFFVDDW